MRARPAGTGAQSVSHSIACSSTASSRRDVPERIAAAAATVRHGVAACCDESRRSLRASVAGSVACNELAPATAEVRHREITQQCRGESLLEECIRPADFAAARTALCVVALGERARTQRARDAAQQRTGAERESAGGQVRSEATQCAGDEPAQHARLVGIGRALDREFVAEALQDHVACLTHQAV